MCCRKKAGLCLQFRLLGLGWERTAEQEGRRAAVQMGAHCHLPPRFLTNQAKPSPAVTQHLCLLQSPLKNIHHDLVFDLSDLRHPLGYLKILTLCFPFHPASLAAKGGLQLSKSLISPLVGALHTFQFRFCNPTSQLLKACPNLIHQMFCFMTHFYCCVQAKGISL